MPGHGDVTEVGGAGDGATGQSGAVVVLGDGLTGVTPGEGVGAGEVPTPPTGPRVLRRRLGNHPYAPLKIASGCDRRCAFCAIPTFRGSYLSRPADDIIAEANWLVGEGVREAMLVSENSSSYGKDWSDPNALVSLLRRLNDVPGLDWVRVSYLQPAEIRPGLIEEMIALDHVVNYFDLSFQHASASVLRRMRRFGDPQSFLNLIEMIRQGAPEAGIRTNVIVGFPGETDDDVATLVDFLTEARLDVVGVFAYSDEEGTEGERLPGHCDPAEIAERRDYVATVVDELCNQRAEERIGTVGQLLIESIDAENGIVGRMAHQGPEVDGQTVVVGAGGEGAGVASGGAGVRDGEPVDVVDGVGGAHVRGLKVGDIVTVRVVDSYGVDLTAELV